jgi:hypothetical protein
MTPEGRALSGPAADGLPCRPYQPGQHARALSRMLIWRLVASAVIAGILTPTLAIVAALLFASGGSLPADSLLLRVIGSPVVLGLILLGVDYLLVRGRLARTLSTLIWAGKRALVDLRATTGVTRPGDRRAAEQWLAAHPKPVDEPPSVSASRAHLQVVAGDLDGARATVAWLPDLSGSGALLKAVLAAQVELAAGQPFDADDLRSRVEREPDPETRAYMAVEVAALIAQARWTCGGDHLSPVDWAVPFVAARDRGTLLRGYWLPVTALAIVSSLVLWFVFPNAL